LDTVAIGVSETVVVAVGDPALESVAVAVGWGVWVIVGGGVAVARGAGVWGISDGGKKIRCPATMRLSFMQFAARTALTLVPRATASEKSVSPTRTK